ncbi:MAG: type IX secretion system membrane protein PorP/SprF [Bacteroidota bacterium]|nr:type IX secretion system membrane protein PorP/SprF [Bacteroidota bacterium]
MNRNFTQVIVFFVLSLVGSKIWAQQDPHYSQFMFNKLTFNPGYAGATDGKICVTLLHRTQWMGFSSKNTQQDPILYKDLYQGDAPVDLVGSINAALSPNVEKFMSRIGVGLTFSKDQLGFETTVMPKFSLAFRQPFSNQSVLGIGVAFGLMQKGLDGSKLNALDKADPRVPKGNVQGTGNDIDFGLYYTLPSLGRLFENFYVGASVTHINQSKITYEWFEPTGSITIDNKMHFYIVTGAEYQLPIPSMRLQPNILIKKDPAKIQADLNCFLLWNQNIRGGLTWRPMDAVVVLAGYEFPFGLNVGYSYDLTTSKILKYSSGSHEIMIRYCFGIKIPPRPRYIRPIYTPRFM